MPLRFTCAIWVSDFLIWDVGTSWQGCTARHVAKSIKAILRGLNVQSNMLWYYFYWKFYCFNQGVVLVFTVKM